MSKDSFILYLDQKNIFDILENEEAGKLIKAIFGYVETGHIPQLDKSLNIAFISIKSVLDRNKEKYEKVVERNKQNIAKRWNKKDTKNTTGKIGIPKDTKNTDSDNDNDSDNEHDSDNDNVHDNDSDKKSIKKEKVKKENDLEKLILENFSDTNVIECVREFIKMRKAIKKPLTKRGLELLISKLYKLTTNINEQVEILNTSIMNNWQGIYPLKKNKNSFDDFKELWEVARKEDEQAGNNSNYNPTWG